MPPQHLLQRLRVKQGILGNLVDDVCEVRKEVSLVLVRQDRRHARIVELDVVVVHLDEVDGRVYGDQRRKGGLDDLRDGALGKEVSMLLANTADARAGG